MVQSFGPPLGDGSKFGPPLRDGSKFGPPLGVAPPAERPVPAAVHAGLHAVHALQHAPLHGTHKKPGGRGQLGTVPVKRLECSVNASMPEGMSKATGSVPLSSLLQRTQGRGPLGVTSLPARLAAQEHPRHEAQWQHAAPEQHGALGWRACWRHAAAGAARSAWLAHLSKKSISRLAGSCQS